MINDSKLRLDFGSETSPGWFILLVVYMNSAMRTAWVELSIFQLNPYSADLCLNPLTAGVAYIRVFIFYKHIKYHLLNMLEIKCDINQQYLKTVDLHFVKSE